MSEKKLKEFKEKKEEKKEEIELNPFPKDWLKIGFWRVRQYDEKRIRVEKLVYNPKTKKARWRGIPINAQDILILKEIVKRLEEHLDYFILSPF